VEPLGTEAGTVKGVGEDGEPEGKLELGALGFTDDEVGLLGLIGVSAGWRRKNQ